jgi:hypothetical protein
MTLLCLPAAIQLLILIWHHEQHKEKEIKPSKEDYQAEVQHQFQLQQKIGKRAIRSKNYIPK